MALPAAGGRQSRGIYNLDRFRESAARLSDSLAMNYENKPQAIEDLEAKDLGIAEVVEVEQDARKPESLRQLSEDAYKQLDKQVCRKVDLIIL